MIELIIVLRDFEIMFTDISTETTSRIYQSTLLLNQIKALEMESDRSLSELVKIQKGMFFISLYATVEYAVTNSCSKFLSLVESNGYYPLQFKDKLIVIILDSEFSSVIDCGKKKVWEKKGSLITKLLSHDPIKIDNTVFPTDGINIGLKQLKDIWSFMHLPNDVMPQSENEIYLNEIKDHRNAIAHGRVPAADVGKRYTYMELEKRHAFISNLCVHIVNSFDAHLKNQTFLKETA